MSSTEHPSTRPATWKLLLAFAIIYFIWGSTYLAVRVGVREVPPFLYAAFRFIAAGGLLLAWATARGEKLPSARQWKSVLLLAVLIFPLDYGLLFWAETRMPSGIAAVEMATIPVFITLLDVVFLRTMRMSLRLAGALAAGVLGVAVLMSNSMSLGEAPLDRPAALALLVASLCWAVATILTRRLALPQSKVASSGAQMLMGGVQLLAASALLGELYGFRFAAVSAGTWLALAYLVGAGSLVGFTAYVWLLHYESPTKVGTYAYVNPVVAVTIGYFFGAEEVGKRTLLGTFLILVSVVVITTIRTQAPKVVKLAEECATAD
jgi:drug/metabolite transporter (DMT)-like permease